MLSVNVQGELKLILELLIRARENFTNASQLQRPDGNSPQMARCISDQLNNGVQKTTTAENALRLLLYREASASVQVASR